MVLEPEQVAAAWPLIREGLETLCEQRPDDFSIDGILERLYAGHWHLWVVWDGEVRGLVATAFFTNAAYRKCCSIPFATGGGAKQFVHLKDTIEAWAARNGCSKMDIICRTGWARYLEDYRKEHLVMGKRL